MKLRHPQETLRLVKALRNGASRAAMSLSLLFRKIDNALNDLNSYSADNYDRWLILSGVFTTAFKRLIMSYIKENRLEEHILHNIKRSIYNNNTQLHSSMFEYQLHNFILQNDIEECDLTIDLIIDQFCYEFAPNVVRERLVGAPFFSYLFLWAHSYEGDNFWGGHSSRFKYDVCHLSFKMILTLQFMPTK